MLSTSCKNQAESVAPLGESFPESLRIKSSKDFQAIFKTRCRVFNEWVTVCCWPNGRPESRLGLSVSRKVGNSPIRNRWKRLIREAFRRHQQIIPTGYDFIVIPQKKTAPPEFSIICETVGDLFPWAARKANKRSSQQKNDMTSVR